MKKNWQRLRYRICMFFFKDIIQDELTEALHPDFGYVWQPDGDGFKYCEQAHKSGYICAQLDFYRSGVQGWEAEPAPK